MYEQIFKPMEMESLNIQEGIYLQKMSQLDSQLNISNDYEETNEEVVKNSFPSICKALLVSQSPINIGVPDVDLTENEKKVVEQLCLIGDKIDKLFGKEIEGLLGRFPDISKPSQILQKLFKGFLEDGQFTWGRISSFLFFGVKLFLRYIREKSAQLLKEICLNIVDTLQMLFAERVFNWIANHGGWQRIIPSNGISSWISDFIALSKAGWFAALIGVALALVYRAWRSNG